MDCFPPLNNHTLTVTLYALPVVDRPLLLETSSSPRPPSTPSRRLTVTSLPTCGRKRNCRKLPTNNTLTTCPRPTLPEESKSRRSSVTKMYVVTSNINSISSVYRRLVISLRWLITTAKLHGADIFCLSHVFVLFVFSCPRDMSSHLLWCGEVFVRFKKITKLLQTSVTCLGYAKL